MFVSGWMQYMKCLNIKFMSPNLRPLEIGCNNFSTSVMLFNKCFSSERYPESSFFLSCHQQRLLWAFPHFRQLSDTECALTLRLHTMIERKKSHWQEPDPLSFIFQAYQISVHLHVHCWGCTSQVHLICRPCDVLQKKKKFPHTKFKLQKVIMTVLVKFFIMQF